MISIVSTAPDAQYPHEYYGLSTDTKPQIVPNASAFYEMDTKTIYLYDAESRTWIAQ